MVAPQKVGIDPLEYSLRFQGWRNVFGREGDSGFQDPDYAAAIWVGYGKHPELWITWRMPCGNARFSTPGGRVPGWQAV